MSMMNTPEQRLLQEAEAREEAEERRARLVVMVIAVVMIGLCALVLGMMCGGNGILSCTG